MKTFISLSVVVCLVAFAVASPLNLSDEQKAKVKVHFADCVKQENLTPEEAMKVHNKDYSNPSENLKCFATCFFEKIGALKNNVIQEDVAKAKLVSVIGEEKTLEVVERCKSIKGDDRCNTGYQIFECLESAKKVLKV